MRTLVGLAFAALLCLVLDACASRATGERPALVVASDLDNRPFAWVNEHGTPRGRDVAMMESLAHALGRELEWRRMPFSELLPAAEKGTVDVVCATLGVTPERAERVLFTHPYFTTEIAVVARAGEGEPRTLADLAGRPVLAASGTTSERAVRMYLPRAVYAAGADSDRATNERLLAREVDAAALDGPAANAMVAASGGKLTRLAAPLCLERYALALPKDRAHLRDALDAELARMEARGKLARLDGEYGLLRAP